jgi:hypothetical protein
MTAEPPPSVAMQLRRFRLTPDEYGYWVSKMQPGHWVGFFGINLYDPRPTANYWHCLVTRKQEDSDTKLACTGEGAPEEEFWFVRDSAHIRFSDTSSRKMKKKFAAEHHKIEHSYPPEYETAVHVFKHGKQHEAGRWNSCNRALDGIHPPDDVQPRGHCGPDGCYVRRPAHPQRDANPRSITLFDGPPVPAYGKGGIQIELEPPANGVPDFAFG